MTVTADDRSFTPSEESAVSHRWGQAYNGLDETAESASNFSSGDKAELENILEDLDLEKILDDDWEDFDAALSASSLTYSDLTALS